MSREKTSQLKNAEDTLRKTGYVLLGFGSIDLIENAALGHENNSLVKLMLGMSCLTAAKGISLWQNRITGEQPLQQTR